jgi:hypothetical protein
MTTPNNNSLNTIATNLYGDTQIIDFNFPTINTDEIFKKQDGDNITGTKIYSTGTNTTNKITMTSDTSGLINVGTIEGERDIISNTSKLHINATGTQTDGITITSQGRVGIGVTDPQEDLELDGNIQLDTGGVQRGRVIFYDKQNDHEHAEVDGLGELNDGGMLAFYTKEDGGNVTEKLRINNQGALGIGGANYGTSDQVLVSRGQNDPVKWVDNTDTTYSGGTGVTINVSNEINIGQSVGTSDSPSFIQLSLGDAGGNPGILNLQNLTNLGLNIIAQIKCSTEGNNGGQLVFYTKEDGGNITEKLRINNQGALGFGGANYGTAGQVLVSNDSNALPSWQEPSLLIATGTGFLDFGSNIDTPINFSNIKVTGSALPTDFPANGSVWTCPASGVYHIECCSYMTGTTYDQIENNFLDLRISTNFGVSFFTTGTSRIQIGPNERIAANTRHISRYINMFAGDQLRMVVTGRVAAGNVRVDYNNDRTMFQILRVK